MLLIINGPNLNLLGRREPEIYGNTSFESYLPTIRASFPGEDIEYFQSNSEGAIIDRLQHYGFSPSCKGIVINPGAYAHYSLAIADAIGAIPVPVIEVHVSNVFAREEYRQQSVTAKRAKGLIAGLGLKGYTLAIQSLILSREEQL